MNAKVGVSVIICCYNSQNRLPETLKHIKEQIVHESILWEVLVIDNNSNDSTSIVAKNLMSDSQIDFTILHVPTPGLSFAREAGIKASKYEYVLFCDDDNWLAKDYISIAHDIMAQNSNVGILGGQSEAAFDGEKPAWFDEIARSYAVGQQYTEEGFLSPGKTLFGAGIILRKECWVKLQNAGFKLYLSGRKGKKMTSGEDTEMCLAISIIGYSLYYSPRLHFYHFIPKQRLTWDYAIKNFIGSGSHQPVVNFYRQFLFGNNLPIRVTNPLLYFCQLVYLYLTNYKMLIYGRLGRYDGKTFYLYFLFHFYSKLEALRLPAAEKEILVNLQKIRSKPSFV